MSADEIYLNTIMQDSDTNCKAEHCMPSCSTTNPVLEKEFLGSSDELPESNLFNKVLFRESKTKELDKNVLFRGFEELITPPSLTATFRPENSVLNSTASKPSSRDESTSNMQASTVADSHLTFSNTRETSCFLIDDVKSILQDLYHRPSFIDQLIDSLHKDIQQNYSLIKLMVLLHHTIECDDSNQKCIHRIQSIFPSGQNGILNGLTEYGLKSQESCETITLSHTTKSRLCVEDTESFSSQLLVNSDQNQQKETKQTEFGRKQDRLIPHHPSASTNKISFPSTSSQDKCTKVRLREDSVDKAYKCVDCNFKTNILKNMNGHLVSHHNKHIKGLKTYTCHFCKYQCADRYRLIEHELTHTKLKHFLCEDCGKEFSTKRGLQTHFKYHSNERPHQCSLCSASFKVKGKLTHHMKLVHINKGKKPYQCGYCQHRASVRGNVNQHIKSVHKGKPVMVKVIEEI